MAKLSSFNFFPSALRWFQSYLTDRSQHVSGNNQCSSALSSCTGVQQGSILGPLFFSLYINDLPLVWPDINTLMYADDTIVYVQTKTQHVAAAQITKAMYKITSWLNYSCLQFNVNQTVGVFFTNREYDVVSNISTSGQNISVVPQLKYLGVLIGSNLSFKAHVKRACNRIKFNLIKFNYIGNSVTFNAAKLYMEAMITSHLTSCKTSWSQTH